jgi:dihydrofolate synthase/folylpolyglutamate synthase
MNYHNIIKHIQSQNPKLIDLSLERVQKIAVIMDLLEPNCPVITVAGTNGKGTTIAALEQIYRNAGYKTAVFTSPFIFERTELFRLNGKDVNQQQLSDALNQVENYRGTTPLTEYEYLILAGLLIFKSALPDIILLEVGLGGRDDVTNMIDPDVAILTNVALDHCQWLGNTREVIGEVKAGIFRENIPIILGEEHPPQSVINSAHKLTQTIYKYENDFNYPDFLPQILNENSYYPQESIACALQAATCLQNLLPIKTLILDCNKLILPSRFQIIREPFLQIIDAAHNPAAARFLAKNIEKLNHKGPIKALFSMFADKDINNTVKELNHVIDEWHIAPMAHPRAASLKQLTAALNNTHYFIYDNLQSAYDTLFQNHKDNNLAVITGSFQVIAALNMKIA